MKTEIVAEIGVNHGGKALVATGLINAAIKAGADSVKFQVFFELDYVKQYEFTADQWRKLFDYCDRIGIPWFASAFDMTAVKFLIEQGMKRWKIPSNPLVLENDVLLDAINESLPERLVISTGHKSVKAAWEWLFAPEITMLYCVSKYPAIPQDFSLDMLIAIRDEYLCKYGLSDHSLSTVIPAAAVALGATMIEKHITLNRGQDGPDHKASLEPYEFKEMVQNVREVEYAFGWETL